MAEHQQRINGVDEPHVSDDAAPVVDVVVLSNDDKLLATLREASSTHHALWHAASPDAAIELVVGGRCGILIVDLALLQSDTLQLLERLQTQFPELIILASGRGDEEVAVASAISSGRIYRFLHKPVSPARASLFLGTATRRYGELREINALVLATLRQKAHRPRVNKIGWGIAAAAVVSVIALWLTIDRKSERDTGTATHSPAEDYLTRAQSAAIDELQRAEPAHPHLTNLHRQLQTLSAQIAASNARQTTAAASPDTPAAPIAPPSAPVATAAAIRPVTPAPTPQIDRARARLAASQLIAPVDDSAAAYLRRARENGEDETRLKITATDLGARLLDQSREALNSGRLDESQNDFDAAAALDVEFELGLPDIDAVRRQLDEKRKALSPETTRVPLDTASQAASVSPPRVVESAESSSIFSRERGLRTDQ